MTNDFDPAIEALLKPKSIAIAGASADKGKIGALPLAFLKKFGYGGCLYPINPKLKEIDGIRCYGALAEIEEPIDLLVVAVAAARIPELLQQCRPGQVKSALVFSSGYAEVGPEGARLQRELTSLARAQGIRLVGPNSVGVVNLWQNVVPAISQVFDRQDLRPGPIAFVTQSGAVGTAITALAHEEGLGLGYFVSTGNEADLDFSDFCRYFIQDPSVRIIAGYVESIRDGVKFQHVAQEANRAGKPIVLVKVGTTEVGTRAVRSHTGALAGSEEVYQAVFKHHAVVRADSIEELLDFLKMFAAYPEARARGRRVAVLSHSGGAGVLMADTCVSLGLSMPRPSEALVAALKKRLPAYASFQNPVDMTANVVFSPEVMGGTVADVLASGEYDAALLCVNLIWRQGEALAEELLAARQGKESVLAVAWIAGPKEPLQRLNRSGVPVFTDPVRCARACAAKLNWAARHRQLLALEAEEAPGPSRADGLDLSLYRGQEELLKRYAIALAAGELTGSLGEAQAAARRLGYPVVAKLMAPGLLHKSDVGGVILGIGNDQELKQAWEKLSGIPRGEREGVLIQKMVCEPESVELFAGVKRDEVFGPVCVFGLGGIYVEVLREVVMRPCPFGAEEALELLREARFFALLDGARGRRKCDVRALAELLANLSRLAVQEPRVAALDLNPLLASPEGAVVLDFKLELASSGAY